jgi:PAS domain S-box-containing protein
MILGFSILRQYLQKIVRTQFPLEDTAEITETLDKLLDLCLYVVNVPYIETTAHFDVEIIKGIADKIRNPAAVIGGNINRLKKTAAQNCARESSVYDTVLEENSKIEHLLRDAKKYLELFEEDPQVTVIHVGDFMSASLEALLLERSIKNLKIDIQIDCSLPYIKGDPKHLERAIKAVLRNSLGGIDEADPLIRISTALDKENYHYLQIEIFNSGLPPAEEYMDKIFAPFFSTKTVGTGIGLSIAQLALRKNYGQIRIKAIPQQGTLVTISLPLPEFCDYPQPVSHENMQLDRPGKDTEVSYGKVVDSVRAYTYCVQVVNGRMVTTHHGPGCIAITGYTPEDFDSDPNLWYRMIYPDDRPRVQGVITDLLSGKGISPIEHRLIRRDGMSIWVRNTTVPLYDIDKKLLKYDGIIQDITTYKTDKEQSL